MVGQCRSLVTYTQYLKVFFYFHYHLCYICNDRVQSYDGQWCYKIVYAPVVLSQTFAYGALVIVYFLMALEILNRWNFTCCMQLSGFNLPSHGCIFLCFVTDLSFQPNNFLVVLFLNIFTLKTQAFQCFLYLQSLLGMAYKAGRLKDLAPSPHSLSPNCFHL